MDDRHHLTRRQAIGAAGTAFLLAGIATRGGGSETDVAQAASATCTMTPEKTEGPYFVDERLNRSDITSNADGSGVQPGTPLALTMYVFDAEHDCAPVSGARVDIWHCNAAGRYSDEGANGTSGETWLRGYQVTDADGKVTFHTIWPGWYSGRAVHIHFKVRTGGLEFTSQLFFTDAMNAQVYAAAPYASRGTPDVSDSADNIYGSDGASLLLHPTASGNGYAADFSAGIAGGAATPDTTDTSVAASLASVKVVRTATGRRQLRLVLAPEEDLTVRVRLTRAGRRLLRERTSVAPGTHTLKLPIGAQVRAGGAHLRITLTDAAGNDETLRRSVHIPRRRA
jgi:protocatechuate 3,4-dioxygenase beta subunit